MVLDHLLHWKRWAVNGTGAAEKQAHLLPPFPGGYDLENHTLPSGAEQGLPWDVDFLHR